MAKNSTNVLPLINNDDDRNAWLQECAAIKCRIEDGAVWAYSGGRLFTVAPIPGFASLPDNSRRLVASMAMQFLPTRVGQTGSGDLSSEVASAISAPDAFFSVRDKDAFEAAFGDVIAEKVDAAKGWDDPAKLSKTEKAERAEIIAASIARESNREKYFAEAVEAAKEAGRNVVKERKRQPKKTGPDKSFDL